ncbi:MAG: multicopper oxidase family protein [Gammaproteobacteria bacterium]|nr:multicopper oxidase family protein [Gammaproteobacteria bacterium]
MFMTRRNLLKGMASLAVMPMVVHPRFGDASGSPEVLEPMSGRVQLLPDSYPATEVWGYGGKVPGPEIRVAQGSRIHRRLVNSLAEPTSVHWHGIHIDNRMDGVPGLTQEAVSPGSSFEYDFEVPDAGTYWYHSHARSTEQVARGLYGALIVEEPTAPEIDREETLILDDWLLQENGQLSPDFMSRHDRSHAGRNGNFITTNGQSDFILPARQHERFRLRLINAANARIFPLALVGLQGWTVALDGMPLETPEPVVDMFFLAPAQRADLIVDVTAEPGDTAYLARFENKQAHAQISIPVKGVASSTLRPVPRALPSNSQQVPSLLSESVKVRLVMEGGAMGRMRHAILDGERISFRRLAQANQFWAFNGTVGQTEKPLVDVARGETVRLVIENDTVFPHGMHLHGQHFCEIDENERTGPLRDTLLIFRVETREIAFVADNPGNWLFHCHTLSHQDSGMKTWIRVRS